MAEPVSDVDRSQAGQNRTKFFKGLVGWLSAAPATFPAPYVVLGDFNSIRDSSECDALRNLPGWTWPMPAFIPTTADARTTLTDPAIIDHFVLSPGLTFERHEVIAFDRLPDFPDAAPHSSVVWKRTTDHRLVRMTIKS